MTSYEPDSDLQQPLLPRFGMLWFFVAVVLVAIALFIVRAADQGQALAATIVFTVCFLCIMAFVSGMCFVVAFLFGAVERAVEGEQNKVESPFIDGKLPKQQVRPLPEDLS
ncbi:MAG: hypothetical protein ACE361_14335 [Aureliella sp.]